MLELIPLRYGVQVEDTTRIDLLVRVVPPAPEVLPERAPLNLSLVLDRSGSMSGQKLEQTLLAARRVIESLYSDDLVSVVVFDDRVQILIPATRVNDRASLLRALQGVGPGGSTALHAGWLEGATQAAQNVDPKRLNRVLLLTDGQANVGVIDSDTIASDVNGLAQRGVSTSTLGFGSDYNEVLLRAMAASGNGNHYFVETPDQLASLFELELGGMMCTVGQKVRLSVESPGTVEVLTRLEKTKSGRLRLNDMVIDNPLSVLLRLKVPPGRGPQACVRLDYFDFAKKCQASVSANLDLPTVSRDQWQKLAHSSLVVQELVLWEAAEARHKATAALDRDDEAGARRVLQEALDNLQRLPANPVLRQHSAELQELQNDIAQRKHEVARKRATSQSHSYSYGSVSLSQLPEIKELMRKAKEQRDRDQKS